jgi:spermidine synthase
VFNWLFSSQKRASGKNPDLEIIRELGAWEVVVGGRTQTGPHTGAMWRDAFRKIPRREIHSGLLLGLGGAGSVRPFHEEFPNASLTAIEHDPVMVEIAKEIGLYRPAPFPSVVIGDARDIVPHMVTSFDLIMLDIFVGDALSPAVADSAFIDTLKRPLSDTGVLLVNFSNHREGMGSVAERFPEGSIWTFRANTLGAFW